jgi:hypothetical protein
MSHIYKGTLGLIGNTPLVEVANFGRKRTSGSHCAGKAGVFQSGRQRERPYC